jgi:hypothetical protein
VEKKVTAAWDGKTGTLTYAPMVLAAETPAATTPATTETTKTTETTDKTAAMSMKVGSEWTATTHRWVEWSDLAVGKSPITTPYALESGTAVSFKILKGASALVAGATVAMASLSF